MRYIVLISLLASFAFSKEAFPKPTSGNTYSNPSQTLAGTLNCEYSTLILAMYDSFGDGWNGNSFCINNECATLNPYTSTGIAEFCVDLSATNDVYCGGGSYQGEISWVLSDSGGNTILLGGAPYEECLGNCIGCSNIYNQSECSQNDTCEWVDDVTYGNCSNYNGNASCSAASNECAWTLCYGGSYGSWSYCCQGGAFETDNSYCQEIEVLECSDMNQLQCNSDDSCDWIDSTESISCNSISSDECSDYIEYGCYLDADCTQWGSWYTWLCYQYGPSYCTGGDITIGDSYCEDSSFVLGDANGDGTLNVSDVILIVQTILSGDYDYFSDYNQDGIINVTDVIGVINAILGE